MASVSSFQVPAVPTRAFQTRRTDARSDPSYRPAQFRPVVPTRLQTPVTPVIAVSAWSKIVTTVSACAVVSTSGGAKRTALRPAPRMSTPRCEHFLDEPVALGRRAFLGHGDHGRARRRSSAPCPRTSPMIGCLSIRSRSRAIRCAPTISAFCMRPFLSTRIVSMAARSSPDCRRTSRRARREATSSGTRASSSRRAAARTRSPWPA